MSLTRRHRVRGAWLAPLCCLLLLLTSFGSGQAMTAAEYLQSLPLPHFAPGNTLPKLSKWSWPLPVDCRIELSKDWDYALEAYMYPKTFESDLTDPNSELGQLMALANSDPSRYALLLYVSRIMPDPLPAATWTYDASGNLALGTKVWSPEAPDSVFQQLATNWADPIRQVSERAPVAIVLNGGEYGLAVPASGIKYWSLDPKVMAAIGKSNPSGTDWWSYISERKAHQEMIITSAVRAAAPNRELYIHYLTTSGSARNRWPGWTYYSYGYQWINTIGDLPSESMYYESANDGWMPLDQYHNDMLTQALNSVGEWIKYGHPLSYNFVEGGWSQPTLPDGGFSDIARYMGFLKCYYTAGMIGGVAAYCQYPDGGFSADVDPTNPPNWLLQMVALARVHALFSYLEPFLRDGYLLPGPNMHVWSTDQPAYEFPTGSPGVRVLARKMLSSNDWLVTAWAADGNDRDVTVTIPQLGQLMLHARACGSVYHITLKGTTPVVSLVDTDGLLPSSTLPSTDPSSTTTSPTPSLTGVSLQADKISPQPLGTSTQLTAQPAGGENVEYQFRAGYQDATGWHWSVLRDYATDAAYTWTPTAAHSYLLAVWAREIGNAKSYDAYGALSFRIATVPISTVTLSANQTSTRSTDTTPITLTATSIGGSNVQYRFRVGYQDTPTTWVWHDLTDYTTTATCTWTPTTPRTYTLVVWAREVGHTNAYDAYATLKFL